MFLSPNRRNYLAQVRSLSVLSSQVWMKLDFISNYELELWRLEFDLAKCLPLATLFVFAYDLKPSL